MIGGDEAEQNDSTDRYQRLQRVGIIRRLQPDRQTQPFVTKYAQYKPEQLSVHLYTVYCLNLYD